MGSRLLPDADFSISGRLNFLQSVTEGLVDYPVKSLTIA